MTDNYNPYDPAAAPNSTETQAPPHPPFPWMRLAYSVLFAVVAYIVFWVVLIVAGLQFIVTAIAGTPNAELKGICQGGTHWLRQLFDYMTFVREELPFPFAPFPRE